NGGTLVINGNGKLKNTTINTGGTLRIAGNVFDGGSRTVTLNAGGTLEIAAGVTDGIGALNGSGELTGEAGSSLTLTSGTFSGTITGDVSITKIGTSTHT